MNTIYLRVGTRLLVGMFFFGFMYCVLFPKEPT